MNGIVINIDPTIFHLGAFELRWYSLAIMTAILAAVLITSYFGKRKGIPESEITTLALITVFSGLLGARLFHVLDRFNYYVMYPEQILQIQQGGLAIWGGLAGGGIAVIIYARLRHLPLGRLADSLAPALLVAHSIGRIGCTINGDAWGGVTSLPWGFIYTHPNAMIPPNLMGLATHPYPVYEIIWNGLALLVILYLGRRFKLDGSLFLSYLSLYSLGRFLLSFVRQENSIFWGLQQAQIVALAVFIVAVAALLFQLRGTKNRLTAGSGA